MPTKLEKDVTRETTIKVNEKNLLVTLTEDQKLKIRPKGKKRDDETIEISLEQLFNQLSSGTNCVNEDKAMINLSDFRSKYLIASEKDIPLDIKVKLEKITVELLNRT